MYKILMEVVAIFECVWVNVIFLGHMTSYHESLLQGADRWEAGHPYYYHEPR